MSKDGAEDQKLEGWFLPDETFNVLTHGAGILLSLWALAVLSAVARASEDPAAGAGALIFGFSLLLVYTCSTLCHAARGRRLRLALERVDHAAIYVLIAGTYTPFALVSLRGPIGSGLLVIVWALAVAGAAYKLFARSWHSWWSLVSYLAMGWLALAVARPLMSALPPAALVWLVAGGVCYTVGTIFYVSRARHAHAVWHVFVLAGSACHFAAVLGALAR